MKEQEGNIQDNKNNKDSLPENEEKERYLLKEFLNDLRMEQQETM